VSMDRNAFGLVISKCLPASARSSGRGCEARGIDRTRSAPAGLVSHPASKVPGASSAAASQATERTERAIPAAILDSACRKSRVVGRWGAG